MSIPLAPDVHITCDEGLGHTNIPCSLCRKYDAMVRIPQQTSCACVGLLQTTLYGNEVNIFAILICDIYKTFTPWKFLSKMSARHLHQIWARPRGEGEVFTLEMWVGLHENGNMVAWFDRLLSACCPPTSTTINIATNLTVRVSSVLLEQEYVNASIFRSISLCCVWPRLAKQAKKKRKRESPDGKAGETTASGAIPRKQKGGLKPKRTKEERKELFTKMWGFAKMWELVASERALLYIFLAR